MLHIRLMPDLLLHPPGLLLLLIQAAVSLMLLLHRLLMFLLLLLLLLLLLRLLQPHELGQLLPDPVLGVVHGDLVLVLHAGGGSRRKRDVELFNSIIRS